MKVLENTSEQLDLEQRSRLSVLRKASSSLVLVGGLTALGFQQAPTNEVVRTAITLEAFNKTDDKNIAAAAAGAATMAIEGGTSTLIALGLTQEKGAVSNFVERYRRRKSAKKALDQFDSSQEIYGKKSVSKRMARSVGNTSLALFLGPGILVVKKHLTGENTTRKQAISTGLGYSALGSVVSAGVFGYGVSSGSEGINSLAKDTVVETMIEYATDAKTWAAGLAIGGVAYGISRLRQGVRNKPKDNEIKDIENGTC